MKIKNGMKTICTLAMMSLLMTGCGGGTGNQPKGDRTEINFLCSINLKSTPAWTELLKAYNDGQGMEDKVFVNMERGNGSVASSIFEANARSAYNVVAINDSQDTTALQASLIRSNRTYAPNGYMVDLTEYAKKDEDFQKNNISKQALDWGRMTFNSSANSGSGKPKHIIGADQNLMAVPYGVSPHFNWYNKALFEAQGVNIISVEEEKLNGTGEYAKVQPHGYAEYKEAPVTGMKPSQTLDGRTVYKVFNNRIGMNWEEMRNFLKYFTKKDSDHPKGWNPSATSTYGFVSEYWFNYGWSVGGDVMGYNGKDYDFTLMDDRPNYIVTADNTVINGSTYNAGDIVRYEDRVNGIENASTKPENIYAIESQYNAVKEYVSLQVSPATTIDKKGDNTYKGYGVADPDVGSSANWFNTSQIAMVRGNVDSIYERMMLPVADKFDICPCETYREYEGGSIYQKDNKEGFANEYLKVIGESYGGEVYTGELKKVNETPIVGNQTTASISEYLVIPACSDPTKYQAAWDFISWVATEGQKYIAKTQTLAPIDKEVLFSGDYAYNSEINKGKNYYALAMMASNTSRGDWGYFENGTWVNNWSGDFNDKVRTGEMTLSDFLSAKGSNAKKELDGMSCVIKGIR